MAARVRSGEGMARAAPYFSLQAPPPATRAARRASLVLVAACLSACGGASPAADDTPPTAVPSAEVVPPSSCAGPLEAPAMLPRVEPRELELAHWLARAEAAHLDLDAVLLDPSEIAAHDAAVGAGGEDLPFARASLGVVPEPALVLREVRERLEYLHERLASGAHVLEGEARADAAMLARFEAPAALPPVVGELRVTTARVLLRCGPTDTSFYNAPIDPAFDRNACSTLERQEVVQVLARWLGEPAMLLVRSRYALGWLPAAAPLSPALPAEGPERDAWVAGARARSLTSTTVRADVVSTDATEPPALALDGDVLLPLDPNDATRVLFASPSGLFRSQPLGPDVLERTARPLTRRAFLTEAFRHLGEPYGWGGVGGGRDCSELVMDVLATFDLDLPRHSARQAEAGSFSLAVPADMPDDERLELFDRALESGIVLLHFPGHIMIYLGRTESGAPRILHSFAEYLEPCGEPPSAGGTPGEVLRRVNRVSVSDLELGRGTSRRAFVERVDRVVVFGSPPAGDLGAPTTTRAAGPVEIPSTCDDSVDVRIVHSPARPFVGHPMRLIVTSRTDPGLRTLQAIAPDGTRVAAEVHRLGGSPWAQWIEIPAPERGRYTVALGDGPSVTACDTVTVARFETAPEPPADRFAAIWEPRWRWEADTEALFAAWVEQLFLYPVGDDRTWTSLSEILQDREHNLLFDHLALDEDLPADRTLPPAERHAYELVPDCADLPFFLRAYFAWKLRLPFAYRVCSRGRAGVPPACEAAITQAMPHSYSHEVDAFDWFARTQLGRAVHSASGRTSPGDDETDLYPVALTREALMPGTVFADPYGHLLVLVQWVPPAAGRAGILMGADAQPDGTIGRRTFWRGTFLFTSDTRDVGAGFKAFRPVVFDDETEVYRELLNEELGPRSGHPPYSRVQYAGTTDDFYDAMEALIDPEPLDPETRLVGLVDALEESVVRRVVSVDNGEGYFREHPSAVIPMPSGTDIFETSGAWEDFSTPSRDMRLLIAFDTVTGFPAAVRRRPERYRMPEAEPLETTVARLEARADALLLERRFSYTRSDGSARELTLAELVARSAGIEVAWNPNDCPEIRWGAEAESEEASTCRRRAPASQVALMRPMRAWFHDRMRPVR